MIAFLEDRACQPDRVANPLDSRDGAGLERAAVHQDGIHLHVSVEIQVRTDPGIEDRIVFEHGDHRFDGVNRRAPFGKKFPAGRQCPPNAGAASLKTFGRNIPRAAVDDERGFQYPDDLTKRITAKRQLARRSLILLRRKGQQYLLRRLQGHPHNCYLD